MLLFATAIMTSNHSTHHSSNNNLNCRRTIPWPLLLRYHAAATTSPFSRAAATCKGGTFYFFRAKGSLSLDVLIDYYGFAATCWSKLVEENYKQH
ncbi:hypothetical protein SESBI_33881 [Sesbania bispinosa]|nr:hypothetical protein SESBI_33881 [Sesbania bispinosa]